VLPALLLSSDYIVTLDGLDISKNVPKITSLKCLASPESISGE
jgi:hypothetical protein